MHRIRRSLPFFAAALLSAALAGGVTLLSPYFPSPGMMYLAAVTLAAFLAGRTAGVLTLAFSGAAMQVFLLHDEDGPVPRVRALLEFALLLTVGLAFIGALKRTRRATAETDELRREAEVARARLRAILDAAPVGVATCDRDGVLDFANAEAERLWGQPLRNVSPEQWAEYGIRAPNGEPLRPEELCLFRSLRGEPDPVEQEVLITRPDGETLRVQARSTALRKPGPDPPEIEGAIVAFVNVTEQRRAEEALRRSEENYRLLAERETQRAEWESLLNRIGRSQRAAASPDAVRAIAAEELGVALNADRCFLAVMNLPRRELEFTDEWRRPKMPPIAGVYPVEYFGPDLSDLFLSGQVRVISNFSTDPLFAPVAEAVGAMGIRAAVAVPLLDEEGLEGILAVTVSAPREWMANEVELAERVAAQMHLASKVALLSRREHNIAERLQEALMPSRPPRVPGLDLAAHYTAALAEARVGGDFFDVFPVDDERVALVIGDLSGKGLAAATQVATIRSMLRFALYRDGEIAPAIQELNAVLNRHRLLTGFASLFVGVYHTGTRVLTYVSCGHEPGLLRRAATGGIAELEATAPVLGTFAEFDFEQRAVTLEPGDELALFTDGLTDAGRERQEFLGIAGLRRLMQATPAEAETALEMALWLVAGVSEHARGSKQDDQCLLVAVARPDADTASPSAEAAPALAPASDTLAYPA